jgi:hypothetical protein
MPECRHDWLIMVTDDDQCERCGLVRLHPSGREVSPEEYAKIAGLPDGA